MLENDKIADKMRKIVRDIKQGRIQHYPTMDYVELEKKIMIANRGLVLTEGNCSYMLSGKLKVSQNVLYALYVFFRITADEAYMLDPDKLEALMVRRQHWKGITDYASLCSAVRRHSIVDVIISFVIFTIKNTASAVKLQCWNTEEPYFKWLFNEFMRKIKNNLIM